MIIFETEWPEEATWRRSREIFLVTRNKRRGWHVQEERPWLPGLELMREVVSHVPERPQGPHCIGLGGLAGSLQLISV